MDILEVHQRNLWRCAAVWFECSSIHLTLINFSKRKRVLWDTSIKETDFMRTWLPKYQYTSLVSAHESRAIDDRSKACTWIKLRPGEGFYLFYLKDEEFFYLNLDSTSRVNTNLSLFRQKHKGFLDGSKCYAYTLRLWKLLQKNQRIKVQGMFCIILISFHCFNSKNH